MYHYINSSKGKKNGTEREIKKKNQGKHKSEHDFLFFFLSIFFFAPSSFLLFWFNFHLFAMYFLFLYEVPLYLLVFIQHGIIFEIHHHHRSHDESKKLVKTNWSEKVKSIDFGTFLLLYLREYIISYVVCEFKCGLKQCLFYLLFFLFLDFGFISFIKLVSWKSFSYTQNAVIVVVVIKDFCVLMGGQGSFLDCFINFLLISRNCRWIVLINCI